MRRLELASLDVCAGMVSTSRHNDYCVSYSHEPCIEAARILYIGVERFALRL